MYKDKTCADCKDFDECFDEAREIVPMQNEDIELSKSALRTMQACISFKPEEPKNASR